MSGELCHVTRAVNLQSQAAGGTLLSTQFPGHFGNLSRGLLGGRGNQQKLQVERKRVVEYERETGAGQAGLVNDLVVSDGEEEGLVVVDMSGNFTETFLTERLEQFLSLPLLIRKLHSDRLVLGRMGDHHQVRNNLDGLFEGNTEEVTGGLGVESHDEDHKVPGHHPHPTITLPSSLLTGKKNLHHSRLWALGAFRGAHTAYQTARESKQN